MAIPGDSSMHAPMTGAPLRWLRTLRWAWYASAAGITLATATMGIDLPLPSLLALFALGAATNPWLVPTSAGPARIGRASAAIGLDVGLFTAALLLTGGAYNPFSLLYLVLVVAAVSVTSGWRAWSLTLWTLLAFAVLFGVAPRELGMPPQTHDEHVAFHLRGMWLAAGVAAGFIVYFVDQQRRELAARDVALLQERERLARVERLASLATLAAGAAHELSTPLSTIAVVAHELDAALGELAAPSSAATEEAGPLAEAREDARLIGAEVRRCREVLDRLAADAGELRGAPLAPCAADELVEAIVRRVGPSGARVRTRVDPAAAPLRLPRGPLAMALAGLVDNALRAAPTSEPSLTLRADGGGWHLEIDDAGPGMDAATLARAGEPFFTTRSAGQGMGLGLFLARELVTRIGGDLRIESTVGVGTRVRVWLPGAATEVP